MSLKRFTDSDALLIRSLINKYGIDGISHELSVIMRSWAAQNPKKYGIMGKISSILAYRAGVVMGTSPSPRKLMGG